METNKRVISGSRIIRKGEAVNSFWMKKWAGVDPDNGDPLWYVNGEGGETTKDYNKAGYVLQGSPMPTFYGGFDTSSLIRILPFLLTLLILEEIE